MNMVFFRCRQAAFTRMQGSCTSHTSLTPINAARLTFEQNKNPENKNLFMQTLAHAYVKSKGNQGIQNEIKAVVEELREDPDFWIPHQSFEAYIITFQRLQNILHELKNSTE